MDCQNTSKTSFCGAPSGSETLHAALSRAYSERLACFRLLPQASLQVPPGFEITAVHGIPCGQQIVFSGKFLQCTSPFYQPIGAKREP